jgi:catechol 2,3-dioxygenase-like lactoylglutathione lyase family enzyme
MPIDVTRVFHLNVNCTDLDRSLHFYRDLLGLTQGAHTVSPEQDGTAFGLDRVAWDAWIMLDERGYDGAVVDLLEWQVPRPTSPAHPGANQLGFARLGFTTPDLGATHARMGQDPLASPTDPHAVTMDGAPTMWTFVVADPDGTQVELLGGDATRFSFVVVNCSDLERSIAFYSDVLGFHSRVRFAPGPRDESALGLGPGAEWEMAYLDDPRGTGAFAVDLVQWHTPASTGEPSRDARRLGPFRLALTTPDVDAAHAGLVERGVRCWSPPARLDMGPDLPPLRALLFDDPDGAVLELIETPSP